MFIIQEFDGNKWIDVGKRRGLKNAQGDAWERSIKAGSKYGQLTRVIVRSEIVLARYGQKEKSNA